MSNPSGTDHDDSAEPVEPSPPDDQAVDDPTVAAKVPTERRFTAPGFDAGSTQIIDRPPPDPETEVFATPTEVFPVADGGRIATPQAIPPRDEPTARRRSWAWVIAAILAIAALAALAALVTILLTRDDAPRVSQEEMVRTTIQNYDNALQKGDLPTLRGITCGQTRDSYVRYDDRAWADTHARVAAARQYPVVASIDEVVVNGEHAEANVTSFMAFDPSIRSTRSFDLQFRDNQWKICQAS
jgi:hypothetical protein